MMLLRMTLRAMTITTPNMTMATALGTTNGD